MIEATNTTATIEYKNRKSIYITSRYALLMSSYYIITYNYIVTLLHVLTSLGCHSPGPLGYTFCRPLAFEVQLLYRPCHLVMALVLTSQGRHLWCLLN